MSHFSAQLNALLRERNWTQAHLANITQIDESKISRWIGDQSTIKPEDLGSLIKALGSWVDTREQGNLVAAHLRDECPPAASMVKITIDERAPNLAELPPFYGSRRPDAAVEEALTNILANIDDSDLRKLVIDLGQMFSVESLQRRAEETKRREVYPSAPAKKPKPKGPPHGDN